MTWGNENLSPEAGVGLDWRAFTIGPLLLRAVLWGVTIVGGLWGVHELLATSHEVNPRK